MRIALFIPCFIDQIYPSVGIAVVRVLERLGHEVWYPESQTCCGQPAFNAGHWDQARDVACGFLDAFVGAEVIVAPSGSCTAMARNFYRDLFRGHVREAEATFVASRVWEFGDFLVRKLGVIDVGARFEAKVTWHDACHGLRELGLREGPRQLLGAVRGLSFVEMRPSDECCGFGGAFSAKFPDISVRMGEAKARAIEATGADYVVSGDSSCLMQIAGVLARRGSSAKIIHLAEVLASS
ncbi:MAG: (Fe-S)-binding protein [Verrucomicrobiae bacterium]|nr:(Fe-S)-binding protein [Verrucomicrobiae bacterium]